MASVANIQLASFIDGTTSYTKDDKTLYYNDRGEVLFPPEIFTLNLNKLRKKENSSTKEDGSTYELTDEGDYTKVAITLSMAAHRRPWIGIVN